MDAGIGIGGKGNGRRGSRSVGGQQRAGEAGIAIHIKLTEAEILREAANGHRAVVHHMKKRRAICGHIGCRSAIAFQGSREVLPDETARGARERRGVFAQDGAHIKRPGERPASRLNPCRGVRRQHVAGAEFIDKAGVGARDGVGGGKAQRRARDRHAFPAGERLSGSRLAFEWKR